jgi:hypothetical protein
MAGLFQHKVSGAWHVVVFLGRDENRRPHTRTRTFKTRTLAVDYMVSAGLTQGRRGRSRTLPEMREHLSANSRLTEMGCHEWTGSLTNSGYGRADWKQADGTIHRGAHRIAYFIEHGQIDPALVIDHLCRNRACINPAHMELVTQRENVLRSPVAIGGSNAAKTHCPQGHPYSPENTYVYHHKSRKCVERVCKTCRAEYRRRYIARRRGLVAA